MPTERRLLETAESIDQQFGTLQDHSELARKLVGSVRSAFARRETQGLDPLADALEALRSQSREAFPDDIMLQVLCGADWWPTIGTELSSIGDPYARVVVELQDLKVQAKDYFYSQLRDLSDCEGACALLMFGNDADDDDMSWINFRRFTQLELLDLAENRLNALPLLVERLPVLRRLNLRRNKRLSLGPKLAERWDTPKLEELDVRETRCGEDFLKILGNKYPDLTILHD